MWLAVDVDGTARAVCLDLSGSPEAIIEQTCDRAVTLLTEQIQLVADTRSRAHGIISLEIEGFFVQVLADPSRPYYSEIDQRV